MNDRINLIPKSGRYFGEQTIVGWMNNRHLFPFIQNTKHLGRDQIVIAAAVSDLTLDLVKPTDGELSP